MTSLWAALAASAREAPGCGVTLLGQELGPRKIAWPELAEIARKTGGGLASAGVEPGDRVLLVLPTGLEFLAAFFGAQALGAIPCPVSPPQGFKSKSTFERRLADLARLVAPRAVVTSADVAPIAGPATGVPVLDPPALAASPGRAARRADPEEPAFIQFTSGTTEVPKGVVLSHRALFTNVRQLSERLGIGPGSVIVSWLPMYHDMGLIGGVLIPVLAGIDLALMSPTGFLRSPRSWFEAIHRYRGTVSPAPTFAFRYAADRVTRADLEGIDLSSWRAACVGAETIQREALAAFEERFGPAGLSKGTIVPCYGLAESCLGVTISAPGEPWHTRSISRRALAERGAAEAPGGAGDVLSLVSCGRPLDGTEVRVVGESGLELPERRIGRIHVRGPALYSGYWGAPGRGDAALDTGDLGFTEGGELYVTGRAKDLIILRGENHHPAEIEWVLTGIPGLREGRIAAFGVTDADSGTEALCVMAELERRAPADPAELETAIRRRVYDETGLSVGRIALVPSGTIPVTTSGKIQRSTVKRIFLGESP